MNIEFIARKTPSCWVFDHEHQNTVDEALCNGTDDVLDEYYEYYSGKQAKVGDQMAVYVSTEDFEDSDTVLSFESTDDCGTTYLDMVLFQKVWLCPWLQGYFGYKPEKLYVKLDPVNLGKISYEETMKRGVNPFRKYLNPVDSLSEFTDEELVEFVNASYENGGRL